MNEYKTSDVSGEHVVWEAAWPDGSRVTTYTDKPEIAEQLEKIGAVVFPVFRFPAITQEEREAIRLGELACPGLRITDRGKWVDVWSTLRGLVDRRGGKQ